MLFLSDFQCPISTVKANNFLGDLGAVMAAHVNFASPTPYLPTALMLQVLAAVGPPAGALNVWLRLLCGHLLSRAAFLFLLQVQQLYPPK